MKRNGYAAGIVNAMIPVAECKPHPNNYNQHGEAQISDLRDSLKQFGQVRSIVVQRNSKGYILVAGHGLWRAAWDSEIAELRADVIPASWSKAKVEAYLAADNELARRGSPDEAQLAALVARVQAAEGDVLARLAAGEQARLDELLHGPNFSPVGIETQPRLDQKNPITCPQCGAEFVPNG